MPQTLPFRNWLQILMIVSLVVGGFSGDQRILTFSAILAIAATLWEWTGLLKLARVFVVLAAMASAFIAILSPNELPALWLALVQGVSFSALMMVLGMLRYPVRRSDFVRRGAAYLLSFDPKRRYAAINVGAHFLSLLFNVGIIALIGDLAHTNGYDDNDRRPMLLAGMRGAALVSVWSPIGLGFAVVTAGVPALDAMQLMMTAFLFTAIALLLTSIAPILPREASGKASPPSSAKLAASPRPLIVTLCVCALLLGLAIGLHEWAGVNFTLASVAILPAFAGAWILFDPKPGKGSRYAELTGALVGLSDLRTESAIFLSANIIGAAISLILVSLFGWDSSSVAAYPILPILLASLLVIPLAAACFIPNTILVVILAQLLGSSPIGAEHPLALGVTLTVSWATAISVSPISAMCLITGSQSGVSSRRVAWRWNAPFALFILTLAAALISVLVTLGY